MAKIDPITIGITLDMLTTTTTGPKVLATVKSSNPDNIAGTTLSALGIANDFATMVTKNKVLAKTGVGLSGLALLNDLNNARIDLDIDSDGNINGKLSDSTLLSLTSDAISLAVGVGAIMGSTSILLPLGLVAATGLAVWSAFNTDNDAADFVSSLFDDLSGGFNSYSDTDRTNMAMMITGGGMPWNYSDGVVPIDPTPPTPPRRDPLVLDSDKDGFISTVALADSNTYFDITGDGIKEKVSWIGANDGILAFDKNGNGKIDGINEVFGNLTTSGFDELKQLIDSNGDGVIDRRDELFSRLQIWHDNNNDGISQTQELVSLKDEGVKSIDVTNVINTNIELGGATLTEASRYTDTQGNRELAADVKLEFNPTLTSIDTSTIPNYSIDLDTLTLPNLRGYGLFMNSFVSYNTNEALKIKAQELVNNGVESMSSGFEEYIDLWSGYTKYVNGVKEKFNITGEIGLGELDKKVWIIDKLLGRSTTAIESNFETQMKQYENTTVDSVQASNVTIDFQKDYYNNYFQKEILDRYEGAFALQAFYKFDGAHYDVNRAKYVVDDLAAFNTSIVTYLNSADNSLEDKL